jgi:transposase-like protein
MEQKKIKQQKRRFTEQGILNLLEEYKQCDSTAIDFCKKHNIVKGTFYAWKKKYHSKAELADKSPGFVPLTINPPDQSLGYEEGVLFAEVIIQNSKSIKLFRQVPCSYLKELIS